MQQTLEIDPAVGPRAWAPIACHGRALDDGAKLATGDARRTGKITVVDRCRARVAQRHMARGAMGIGTAGERLGGEDEAQP